MRLGDLVPPLPGGAGPGETSGVSTTNVPTSVKEEVPLQLKEVHLKRALTYVRHILPPFPLIF